MTDQQRATMQEDADESPVGDDEIDLTDLVQEMDRTEQELDAAVDPGSMIGGRDFEMLEFDEHDLFGTFIDDQDVEQARETAAEILIAMQRLAVRAAETTKGKYSGPKPSTFTEPMADLAKALAAVTGLLELYSELDEDD